MAPKLEELDPIKKAKMETYQHPILYNLIGPWISYPLLWGCPIHLLIKAGKECIERCGLFLDIPSGPGNFYWKLVRYNSEANYVAVDLSLSMLQRVKRIIPENVEHALLIRADAENLPFRKDTFNGCFSANGLHAFSNPNIALSEIHRILKPGSILTGSVVVTPKDGFWLAKRVMRSLEKKGSWGKLLSRDNLDDIFKHSGFKDFVLNQKGFVVIFRAVK